MIILHNPLDKVSRDFVASHGAGHTILEYPDCVQRYPYISAFPSVVVAETATEHYICRQPQNWIDVEEFAESLLPEIAAKEQTKIKRTLTDAVQRHLDATAQAAGYDDIKSAVTYADEPAVLKFQQEGQRFRAWRSLVWAACYAMLAAVMAGTRTVPTVDELLAELPALEVE
jgi:hypothetical protein